MKRIKIGFLGLGVVGAELVNIIQESHNKILELFQIDLVIGKVFVRDLNKKRGTNIDLLELTTDPNDILLDDDTNIICECVGGAGTDLTLKYVKTAFEQSKSVVMSSKKALAFYAEEILNCANTNNVSLKYDATVGGGIPIAKIMENCFYGENIIEVTGVVNATSNFIYTKMLNENETFEKALKEAQINGYAENDPSEDILGYDALFKSVILSTFSMNKYFNPQNIEPVPFSNIELADMHYANDLGYTIKPIIHIERDNDTLLYIIGPCLIKKSDIIANTFLNNNIIKIKGTASGTLGFYGQGAGNRPTAAAMFDDIVRILKDESKTKQTTRTNSAWKQIQSKKSNQYLRIRTVDEIGILSKITGVLANRNINIDKILQRDKTQEYYDVIVFTSHTKGNYINNLKDEFKKINAELISVIPVIGE
ncbi:MAG: homoserine dehydrogenase [Oscillospiraceae bacterium]|nr:homoserine dehydrogenase [Oscillospiraceae bacterium]